MAILMIALPLHAETVWMAMTIRNADSVVTSWIMSPTPTTMPVSAGEHLVVTDSVDWTQATTSFGMTEFIPRFRFNAGHMTNRPYADIAADIADKNRARDVRELLSAQARSTELDNLMQSMPENPHLAKERSRLNLEIVTLKERIR